MIGLVLFVICVIVTMTFICVNLRNVVDISLVFWNFSDVPIYIPVFAAFSFGVILTIVVVLFSKRKPKAKAKIEKKNKKDKNPPPEVENSL
ncbi:MAG: DUF1049 domain-containing protein [Spirochaetaceae bacterium]|nr:DUF1049 domain-containing protein [Spirochaetaceae bacterium]